MSFARRAFNLCAKAFATGALALVLTACSRTVTWEEEVPLNTGETIWIERTMPWEIRGSQGNPYDLGMRPTRVQTLRFKYGSTEYVYVGRADIRWIAVSPITKQPVLVAPASSFGWDSEHNFLCTVPHYVQLMPDTTGKKWSWPEHLEPWLFDLPGNVMAVIPALKERRQRRYTSADIARRDGPSLLMDPISARIQRDYKESGCLSRFGSGSHQPGETR